MRVFFAQSLQDNSWFQRVDTGVEEGAFRSSVAKQFNVDESIVRVEIRELDKGEHRNIIDMLATGVFEGRGVSLAPVILSQRELLRQQLNQARSIDDLREVLKEALNLK